MKRLNYTVDTVQAQYNCKHSFCVVWDTHSMQQQRVESIQQVEEDYLKKKMEEAMKNTNIFTDEKCVKIHQFDFQYIQKANQKKAHQICCFVVVLDDPLMHKNLALIKNLEI